MDVKHVYAVARKVPNVVIRAYDGDHFEIYHPPLVAELLADQTAFLRRELHVGS